MVIKQQIFKSILELFSEMRLDLAVRRCHGGLVLLCQSCPLEGGLGLLSVTDINAARGVCTNKCFWKTSAVF